MGVIPTDYNKFHGKNDARFSFLNVLKIKKFSMLLITAVETWAKSKIVQKLWDQWHFPTKNLKVFYQRFRRKSNARHQSQFSVYGRFHQGKSLRKLCRFGAI